jgi:hypothetical protein
MYNVTYGIFDNGLNTDESDWKETDPTSRQRGHPTERTQQLSGHGFQIELDTTTYWLTDRLS